MLILSSVILTCGIFIVASQTATFSPVLSDDGITPFSFTSEVYDSILIVTNQPQQYVLPLVPHMGVPEPFGGNPSGSVEFTILDATLDAHVFQLKTFKLGRFFFLQIFMSLIESNRKRPQIIIRVKAVFISDNVVGATPIRLQNTSRIRINVLDRNENCPFFSSSRYHFSVLEGASLFYPIGTVSTADADSGINAQAYFYLDPAEEEFAFYVHPRTGKIYRTKQINSDRPSFFNRKFTNNGDHHFEFKVFAAQRGDSSQVRCNIVSVTNVRIDVLAAKPNPPTIVVDPFRDIPVPGISGAVYARVMIVDNDLSTVKQNKLTIVEPDMREKFELVPSQDPSEWLLQLRRNLSSISLAARILLTLEVISDNFHNSEPGGNFLSPRGIYRSRQEIDIPVVSKSTYRIYFPSEVFVRISEATLANCTIAILNPNASYSMTNFSFAFTILYNTMTGVSFDSPISISPSGAVVLKRPLDVDSFEYYKQSGENHTKILLPFTVVDRNNMVLSSARESRLIVEVQDINDNDPVVRNNASVFEIREDAAVGTAVFQVDAFDPDLSRTRLSYVLHNSANLPFTLSSDGELIVDNMLDAETMPDEFIIYISVSDSGFPLPRSVISVFTVHLIDVNEHAPKFVELSCHVWLPVTEAGLLSSLFSDSGFVLGRYSAEDADRDGHSTLKIRLASSSLSRPCFKVDETTGEVIIHCRNVGLPNSKILLTLLTSDGTKSSVPFILTIHLVLGHTSQNNVTQRCQPSGIYEDIQNMKLRRKEYELTATERVEVRSINANQHRPKFPSDLPTRIHIPENVPIGTTVFRFTASDGDGVDYTSGQIIYGLEALGAVSAETFTATLSTSITNDFQQAFLLRPINFRENVYHIDIFSPDGISLVVAAPLDREIVSSYSLILHACDLGAPSLCTSSPLHIYLEDLDDNPPEFAAPVADYQVNLPSLTFLPTDYPEQLVPGVISVPEDVPIGARIGQVLATDRDVTDEVRYRLITYLETFEVHPTNGTIRLLRGLDREVQSSYELVIEAAGRSRWQKQVVRNLLPNYMQLLDLAYANSRYLYNRSSVTRVVIVVTDVNDNPPVFVSPGFSEDCNSTSMWLTAFECDGYNLYIPDDTPEGAYLTTLRARDADAGDNALIGYSIFGNPKDVECFHVDRLTGVVRLTSHCELSKFRGQSIRLSAWAFDHGSPQLKCNNSFVVHVLPVLINVFPPTFHVQPALYSGVVAENLAANSPIYMVNMDKTILRLDTIDHEGAAIDFWVAGGSGIGYFHVDHEGTVRTRRPLDAESVPDEGGYWLTVYAVERSLNLIVPQTTGLPFKTVSTESNGPMRALAEVFIEVMDENDNYPIPYAPEYVSEIAENSPPGVLVATVSATDKDKNNLSLHYRISVGDPQGHFAIEFKSGEIRTTARPLDREAILKETGIGKVNLVVTITDRGIPPLSCDVRVVVAVLDENDQTPKFVHLALIDPAVLTGSDIPTYHFRVYETEQDAVSGCVGRVFAVDLDASVNGSVFYWRDTVLPDSSIGQLHVQRIYPDGGFNVHPTSGLICSDAAPLQSGEYRIRVFAKDRGQPARIANENKAVVVQIIILPSPLTINTAYGLHFTFSPPKQHILRADQLYGQRLFTFAVADRSNPRGITLTYSLTTPNNSRNHPFGLGQLSHTEGFVFLAERLDLQRPSVYPLTLTVSNGYNQLIAETEILVETSSIEEIEFLPSEFATNSVAHIEILNRSKDHSGSGATGLHVQANVSESVSVGSLICLLKTRRHSNMSDIRSLEYSVHSVGQAATLQTFSVHKQSGELRVARRLDCEHVVQHYLLVSVRSNDGSLAFVSVLVNVHDTNEHFPQFVMPITSLPFTSETSSMDSFVFYTVGTSPVGTVVGRVVAFDWDSGENGRITYTIIGGDTANYFAMDSGTGDLRVAQYLLTEYADGYTNPATLVHHPARPWRSLHRLVVAATDAGRLVSNSNHTVVYVRLIPGPGGIDIPPPRFRPPYVVHLSVMENNPPGYIIAPISRFLSPESVVHGFLHFELVHSHTLPDALTQKFSTNLAHAVEFSNTDLFHVTPDTGLLVAMVSLDRERHGDMQHLLIRVRGVYGIYSELSDYLVTEVHILDENDNAPVIHSPLSLVGHISEDSIPGALVFLSNSAYAEPIQIEASDPDLGLNSRLTYQFISPCDDLSRQAFTIDPVTGLLRLSANAVLDREQMTYHVLSVQISDSGSPSLTADTLVRITVHVVDVNDCPPIFSETFYIRTLVLPTYPSEPILQVLATDRDANDFVSYRMVHPADSSQFNLDQRNGHLRVSENSTLLRNAGSRTGEHTFTVEVEAYDTHEPNPHTSRVNITVFTQIPPSTVDDHTTVVVHPEDGLDIDLVEHYSGSQPLWLGQLRVRNAPFGAVHRFSALTPLPGIVVDRFTGIVMATGDQGPEELDRELTPELIMHVLVRDVHNRLGRAVVRIRLLDINDHAPVFLGQPYHTVFCLTSVSPERPKTAVESRCQRDEFKIIALDKDEGINSTITFSLTNVRPRAEPALLSINAQTGQLNLLRRIPPDWNGRQLDAVIVATDGGGLSSTASLTVYLVSAEGPKFSALHYTASISESAAVGEAVTSVEATSALASANLFYRLVSLKSGKTTNDSHTPLLHSVELPDSPFLLEFNTGIVRLVGALDYEVTTTYLMLLEVLDTSTSLLARVHLVIHVTDTNDVAPRFSASEYTVFISEREPVGHSVLQLEASDPDSGSGGQITFTLTAHHFESTTETHLTSRLSGESEVSLSHFHCNENTGQITLARKLDFRTTTIHRLWAVASDRAPQPLISRIPITIHVLDYNDHAPVFDVSMYSIDTTDCLYNVKLSERAQPGTFVLRLLATDEDINDTLRYYLTPSTTRQSEYFRLGLYDGVLRWFPYRTHDRKIATPVWQLFDYSTSWFRSMELQNATLKLFELQVQVTDGVHTTSCDVRVDIEPTNWDAPRFTEPKRISWNVTESLIHLGRIRSVVDHDRGDFGRMTFALVGGRGREQFRLDSVTGDLYALEPLDRESVKHYELLVRATDGGGLFDHVLLELNVIDVNDNRPRFLQSSYSITLYPEDYSPSGPRFPLTTALQLQAIDADSGLNSQLVYRFFRPPSVDSHNAFELNRQLFDIDPTSGHLVLKTALLNISHAEIQLFAEACDSPNSRTSSSLCSSPTRITVYLAKVHPDMMPRIACTSSPIVEDDRMTDREAALCQVHPNNLTGTWLLSHILHELGATTMPPFRIDPLSGVIRSTFPLDYERCSVYRLGVEFHMDSPALSVVIVRTELLIRLVDLNDCVPELDTPVYTAQVLENVPIGTHIIRVLARDQDMHGNDPISYSLWPASTLMIKVANQVTVDGDMQPGQFQLKSFERTNPEVSLLRRQFEVNSEGWISLKAPLDFESNQVHEFKVVAMDSVGHWNSSLVLVSVTDVNDNAPHWPVREFVNGSLDHVLFPDVLKRQILYAEVTVPENWDPGPDSLIYQLRVMDPDVEAVSSPTFYLLPEINAIGQAHFPSGAFISVSASGAVRLRHALDRELSAHYILRFQASDGLFVTRDAFVLQINIVDVNDNAPICLEPSRHLSFPEDTAIGATLTQLVAADADAEPQNSNVTYHLVSDDSGLFSVNQLTGILQLQNSLDFETQRIHTIIIMANDSAQLACRFFIHIRVLDVNDNPPEFESISIGSIPEDAPLGSLVGKVTARDRDMVDANRLVYSLHAARECSFGLEPQTGLLKVIRTLDRETKSVHTLIVLVTDGHLSSIATNQNSQQFTATATFTISLLDVNDSPPQFVNTSAHKLRVSELAPIGQHLLRLNAVSLDEGANAVVQYTLLTKQAEFSLNQTSGDLHLESSLDHERSQSYFLTVEARDHGSPPLSTTTVVTVNVNDENDNRPVFEGRQTIPSTLMVPNQTPLNEEMKKFLSHYYSFSVVENSRKGTVIGRLKATDADHGDNGRLVYRLASSNSTIWMTYIHHLPSTVYELLSPSESHSRFQLDPDSGQLSLSFEPDRELIGELWFEAVVSDQGSPVALSSHTLVRVRILDVNDCPPVFEKSSYEFVVEVDRAGNVSGCHEVNPSVSTSDDKCHSAPGGRVLIGRFRLTDADADPNAGPFGCQLTYSGGGVSVGGDVTTRSESLYFVRNSSSDSHNHTATDDVFMNTGECLLYALDRLPVGSQSLVLRANDNGLTALHTSITVTVRVIRQANLPPEIVRDNITVTYYRGSHVLTQPHSEVSHGSTDDILSSLVIARITVKDRTAHDRLTFDLIPNTSGPNVFHVDRYDGTIRSTPTKSDTQSVNPTDMITATRSILPAGWIPLSRLDSGLYPLRIRVTNGSLTAEETIDVQVLAITDEMLESSAVIRISNLLPNLFYMENYDQRLRSRLASLLLADVRSTTPLVDASRSSVQQHIYILSVQEADVMPTSSIRMPRSLDRAVDVLVAVYDAKQGDFVKPHVIADALHRVADSTDTEFGDKVTVIHDICTVQFCPRGRCFTRVTIEPHGVVNRVEVHRISQVSPRFTLTPMCRCPQHFTGLRCDIPSNGCALATCTTPRICIPQGGTAYTCVCPPPRTGHNCESVQPIGEKDACYTERCFVEREHGPLQFIGGSFLQWELVHSNPHHLELSFAVRTRQTMGPLVAVRWSALRAFQLRVATGGRLVVSSTGLNDGLPSSDWLVSAAPICDGHWHRVRLVLISIHPDRDDFTDSLLFRSVEDNRAPNQSTNNKHWWVELTVNGIHPRSASIDWAPGDPVQQGILLGVEPVNDFSPLSSPPSLYSSPVLGHNRRNRRHIGNNTTDDTTVLRSGIVGCFRDIQINKAKPPYQVNYQETLTALRSAHVSPQNSPTLILMRVHQVTYGCDPAMTVSGPCASGPCIHGGTCNPGVQRSATGPYTCHCPALFHGHHCERTSDACLLRPCQNGGNCVALLSSRHSDAPANSGLAAYRCVCPAGVSGLHCETVHDASLFPIVASSQYPSSHKEDGPGCRSARLMLQYPQRLLIRQSPSGTPWAVPISSHRFSHSAEKSVCLNKGICLESPSGPYCSCPIGWQGARCEHDVNECHLAELLFSRRTTRSFVDSTHFKWMDSHGNNAGGLCSPFEVGRGVCVNTPGSYQCNCSLGFTGRHCQSKNLIPLTPDPNALGLTQFHVYIIIGLLTFLFLAALTAIVILAYRARGLINNAFEPHRRTVKSTGQYMWASRGKHPHKHPSGHFPDQQFYRYNHSESSSLAGVPFLSPASGHPVHLQQLGTYSSCHGFPRVRSASRRPSLASSTFVVPGNTDDSSAPLIVGPVTNVQHGSNSSAAPTITDYMDRDDSSVTGGSRLVLYPTASGDAVPVVMMMSPGLMAFTGSTRSVDNRGSFNSHYSPASSVLFNGPSTLSGAATPTNCGTSYVAYNIEPPGSACISPRHAHTNTHIAFIPTGPHHACIAHPQTQHPFTQLLSPRPGSVVGSDRLSLGSGSDRFSAHSSQVLLQPSITNGSQSHGHHAPQMQQAIHPSSSSVPLELFDSSHSPHSDGADGTLRPVSTSKPDWHVNGEEETDTVIFREYCKPRPVPPNMQHFNQPTNHHPSHSFKHSDSAICAHSSEELGASVDGDLTPTLHKVTLTRPVENCSTNSDQVPLREPKTSVSEVQTHARRGQLHEAHKMSESNVTTLLDQQLNGSDPTVPLSAFSRPHKRAIAPHIKSNRVSHTESAANGSDVIDCDTDTLRAPNVLSGRVVDNYSDDPVSPST